MRHYCTYCDRNYLARAIALAESLNRHEHRPFTLTVVCLDETTRMLLGAMRIPQVVCVPLHAIERGDDRLLRLRNERTPVEYYWTLTPVIVLRLLEDLPRDAVLTYLDADLYFFSSPDPIFDELGEGSVAIHEHRYGASLKLLEAESGRFNVGLLCFRNDRQGLDVLGWWQDRCLEWCFARYEEGKMGDQLYLNRWPELFPETVVLKHPGIGLAPWNAADLPVERGGDDTPSVGGSPAVFFHFHSLQPVRGDTFVLAKHRAYPFTYACVHHLYRPYCEALLAAHERIRRHLPDFGFGIAKRLEEFRDHTILHYRGGKVGQLSNDPDLPDTGLTLDDKWSLSWPAGPDGQTEDAKSDSLASDLPAHPPKPSETALLESLVGSPLAREMKVVYVVGAFRLEEHELLHRAFPNAKRFVLFEPLPAVYDELSKRFGYRADVTILPYAISDGNHAGTLYVTNNQASSSLLELGDHKRLFPWVAVTSTSKVECRTLDRVIKDESLPLPDALLLDIQGAEFKALSSLSRTTQQHIKLMLCEASLTEVYKESRTLHDLKALLQPDFDFLGFCPLTEAVPGHGNALFARKGIRRIMRNQDDKDSRSSQRMANASGSTVKTPIANPSALPVASTEPGGAASSAPLLSYCIITNFGLPEHSHRKEYLERLLRSIHKWGGPAGKREVLVVGAIGPLPAMARGIDLRSEARDGRVCRLRNAAVDESRGRIIVHCDDDVMLTEGYWDAVGAYLDQNWSILNTRLLNPNGTRNWDWAAYIPGKGQTLLPYDVEDPFTFATGGHALYRREVFEKVKWNEDIRHGQNEEHDLARQAREAGFRFRLCKEATVFLQYPHCDANAAAYGSQPVPKELRCPEFEATRLTLDRFPYVIVPDGGALLEEELSSGGLLADPGLVSRLEANNFFDYPDFYRWVAARPGFSKFVEIGVWKGHSITFLANLLRNRSGLELYAVDLFEDTPGMNDYPDDKESVYAQYNAMLSLARTRHLIRDIRQASDQAAAHFPDRHFDFVFVDADHEYAQVRKDIQAWLPKVRPGGIIAGHDYGCPGGVKQAVDELFPPEAIKRSGYSVWFVSVGDKPTASTNPGSEANSAPSSAILSPALANRFRHKLDSQKPPRPGMPTPKVSILVACNRYLQRFRVFLQSICRQTYDLTAIEVVVANPHSPDGLSNYLGMLQRVLGEKGPSVREVLVDARHYRNRGFMIQRAFEASNGTIILGMDCDLILPPHFLKELVPVIQANEDAVVGVYRRFLKANTTESILAGLLAPESLFATPSPEDEQEEMGYRGVLGYCQAVTRKAWEQVGYPEEFDNIAKSDVAFVERLAKIGVQPKFLKDLHVLHLHHPRNWEGTSDFL